MARFDRYVLSQLVTMFGFFSLILVMVYWINQAVRLFDQLVADGQNFTTFLEFSALSLPNVIRLALPLSSFVAAVYVTNRMAGDSELTVVQSTGFSPFRLARPVLTFGLFVAALMSVLMHVLVPLSATRLADREAEIAQNITARFLTEGQFMEPAMGVTVYIRDITPAGELRDVFLSDVRDDGTEIIYTAAQAYLVRGDGQTQLVMIDGLAQTLQVETNRLITTSFADFTYDVATLIAPSRRKGRSLRELSTWELLNPTQERVDETGQTPARMIAEAHDRVAEALLGTIGALLGFAALVVGGFSRFGLWRQIGLAIGLIIVVKALETVGLDIARGDPSLWYAVYLASAAGFLMVLVLLALAANPALLRPRSRAVP